MEYGSILLSVQIANANYRCERVSEIKLQTEEHLVKMHIIGMRNLKSSGIFQVKRAILKIDLKNFT